MDRTDQLKESYHLQPHPEGGWFTEVWDASREMDGRPLAGSIYFLLQVEDISHLHVIDCDEVWYYHEGCGMELTVISPDGTVSTGKLGANIDQGEKMMVSIPAGTIFGARNLDASGYTFVSCATAPRFTYEGFRMVGTEELQRICPQSADTLRPLVMEEKK